MLRRLLDILASFGGLVVLGLPLAIISFFVWRQDRHSPFYVANRVGRGGVPFRMVKIRSMVINADKTGVESTSAADARITPLGHFIRGWKIDELSQLWNVLKGDMSLVGPRPNTLNEVATYAPWERELLTMRPGITDFSSIVFSDEGAILKDSKDPDADYTRLIRPWKGKLGLEYVKHASVLLNLRLILLTVLAILNKQAALRGVVSLLQRYGADQALVEVSRRERDLSSYQSST
jgi:lipopolysaccharide/colanic/teichoic acid biosynthesis glycosyltransferase